MDLKKLRERAEAASPGEWVARAAGWTIRAYVGRDLAKDGVKIALTCAMMGQSQGLTPDVEQQVANQEYIAAAQPKTVLALLDIIEAPRRTNAQIQTEREITATSLEGAMAFGYQNTNPPPAEDHWLAPFWDIGRKQAELEKDKERLDSGVMVYTTFDEFGKRIKVESRGNDLCSMIDEGIALRNRDAALASKEGVMRSAVTDLVTSDLVDLSGVSRCQVISKIGCRTHRVITRIELMFDSMLYGFSNHSLMVRFSLKENKCLPFSVGQLSRERPEKIVVLFKKGVIRHVSPL